METTQESHVSTGAYSILESASVYGLLQKMVGAHRTRKYFIEKYVHPFSGAHILDIGCGTAVILDYLPEDVKYVGYDLNAQYIAAAQKKHGDKGQFICARVEEMPAQREAAYQYDIVLAMAILHHLDEDEAGKLIRAAYHHLKPGGHLATLDGCYHADQSPIARFIISRDRGKNVRTPEGYKELVSSHFEPVVADVETHLYRMPYSLFMMRAVKRDVPRSPNSL